MKHPLGWLAVSLLCLAACSRELPTSTAVPTSDAVYAQSTGAAAAYSAQFDDAVGKMLRSDGRGLYVDGYPDYTSSCVDSKRHAGGLYLLRTIANTGDCKAVQRPGWRYFTFDMGAQPLVDLDQDGVAELIEAAPARLGASAAFAHGSTSTPITIFILEVRADGSTTQNFKWTLRYTSEIPITGSPSRTLEASPANATVHICAGAVDPKKSCVPTATTSLPFKLTISPAP